MGGAGAAGGSWVGAVARPAREIIAYARAHGAARLADGFGPLLARECVYIAGITWVSPLASAYAAGDGDRQGRAAAAAFGVGVCAGLITAPFQTVSALLKHDRLTPTGTICIAAESKTVMGVLRSIFSPGWVPGIHRLYFGAATRSVRTGGAATLYYFARLGMEEICKLEKK